MHTPYDGSNRLFQIGVKPLGGLPWLEADGQLEAYLSEKDRLLQERPDDVFAAEAGTETAQAEVLALVLDEVARRYPGLYRREGDAMRIGGTRLVPLAGAAPLRTAARLVQEDLLLLRKGEAGWRLAAGSLSFPSSWSLREKMGLPIHDIHAPVPGFGEGTRNATIIGRMFDHQPVETPVLRWNWSLYGDDRRHHPETADPQFRRFGEGPGAPHIFLRVERQTLRKLPASGDILFTVRIFIDPLAALETHAEGLRIAAALAEQLEALTAEQLEYKGMTAERARVLERLTAIASR